MHSFWYSLIVFCLLLCSCKSKKIDSNIRIRSGIQSELSYFDKYVKIDTSRTAYFANEVQSLVIEEDIKVIEYDKESGKPIKETITKRKTTQDTDKVASKKGERGTVVMDNDSLNHIEERLDIANSDTETVTECNGLDLFGKWFGIILGLGILVSFTSIYKKFKGKIRV